MNRLAGKVAVVTGGASGIGEASVRLFHDEGAHVVAADVQADRGKALADALGAGVVFQHADVRREADVEAMIARAVDEFGRLDVLFNNAGFVGASGPIDETPADAFDATLAVLLRGVFLGMKHAAPIMKRQRSGSIVSTASVAALRAGLGPHAYSTAKAGVVHLTRSVALELAEYDVRVNCICPGGVVTPLLTQAIPGDDAERVVSDALAQMHPLRRACQPEDIARAALWLASDEAGFVTAETLVVDGGMSAGRSAAERSQRAREWRSDTGQD
jgi:NAD(P)-dependent dehydrogenase (short-subunit alcohol dehydrogenase family)